ncbi:MAG: transporter substrate-binding domain-containing protein [Burkholderiales bacterium]|nr:transporter substrate-binding domain-containing protein [Burkholderiales bacterium]
MLATGNPEYPPYLWRDPDDESRLIGANADLMQLLAKELGLAIEVKYVGPWGRVQEEAKLGRVDLLAGAFFTLPRLDYMDYFYPAFRETRTVIWTRSNHQFSYKKWADLAGRQGVTVINNSFGEEFDRYAKESLRISMVPSLEQALKMLSLSRADYLIYEEDPGLAYVAKLNISGLTTISPPITNENLYLTFSHKSACNSAEMRGRIAKAIYKLDKQNVMNKLIASNIQLWRKQQTR